MWKKKVVWYYCTDYFRIKPKGESADDYKHPEFNSGEYKAPVMDQSGGLGEQSVKADVGASIKRDSLDQRLLGAGKDGKGGEYQARDGTIIDDPSDVGGWPTLTTAQAPPDTDQDGIEDSKEPAEMYNNPSNAQLDNNSDGHTNLEDYLQSIIP